MRYRFTLAKTETLAAMLAVIAFVGVFFTTTTHAQQFLAQIKADNQPAGLKEKIAKIEYVHPAPGCPDKAPTYQSLRAVCTGLDQPTCKSTNVCKWGNDCLPLGGYAEASTRAALRLLASHTAGKHIEAGEKAVARNQLKKGIAGYTKALEDNPELVEALAGRGLAFEITGDRERALNDWCRLIVVASFDYVFQTRGRERVAAITGQPIALRGQPNAPGAAPPVYIKPVVPPLSSALEHTAKRNAIAPLTIVAGEGTSYLIKLVDVTNERNSILIFLRPGESYSTKVPLGSFTIRAAVGTIWYGRKDLFGDKTSFFRLRRSDGKPQVFVFHRQGNVVHGRKIILRKTAAIGEGKLEEEVISRSQF
jgi:tetratricopeptide (TPR) repeat protein